MAAARKKIAVVTPERGLNLRRGPDLGCPRIAVLPAGTQVVLLSLPAPLRREGWAAVAVGELAGWVMAEHLAFGG